jgi:hypothetical protein
MPKGGLIDAFPKKVPKRCHVSREKTDIRALTPGQYGHQPTTLMSSMAFTDEPGLPPLKPRSPLAVAANLVQPVRRTVLPLPTEPDGVSKPQNSGRRSGCRQPPTNGKAGGKLPEGKTAPRSPALNLAAASRKQAAKAR